MFILLYHIYLFILFINIKNCIILIAISNICRASIITADQSRFLIIHGKGQTSTAVKLSNKDKHVTDLNNKDLSILNNNKANEFEKV